MMKEMVGTFVVALVIGAFLNGFNGGGGASAVSPPSADGTPSASITSISGVVANTSDANFDTDVKASNTPVLVDFYSDSCPPCREMAPVVEKLAGEYGEKVKFVKLDVDSNPSITAQYNVSTIPTFIVFKNGERQESFTGLVPKDILASAINKSIK